MVRRARAAPGYYSSGKHQAPPPQNQRTHRAEAKECPQRQRSLVVGEATNCASLSTRLHQSELTANCRLTPQEMRVCN
ncbi:hypothetical protein J6590_004565 [Homalodisca vitripennis]|nr:hypothetical protein J6590_004565 [Homalodisca vitripennis]